MIAQRENLHKPRSKGLRQMDHFPIVLALVRAAAKERNPAVLQHANRLREALSEDGASEEAQALEAIFENQRGSSGKLAPARVVASKAMSSGEPVTPNTAMPVDKETSTPLAELWTLDRLQGLDAPILDERPARAIKHLLEQWSQADRLQDAGVKVPRATLFFGPPGTGKTRLALWVAHRLGLPVVLARLDGLTSSYLGTTARNVRALFDFANRHRCMLLLDEFDGIAKLRDDPQELGEVKRVVNAVLQAMDSRAGIGLTIALTNHENLLDPAVWRRFDARMEIGLPSAATRQLIAEHYLKSFSVPHGAVKILAWMSEGLSGSDVETMCDFIKRYMTLHAEDHTSVVDALELFLELSASTSDSPAVTSLKKGRNTWIQEALRNRDVKLTQADIAEAMKTTQSTVSRLARTAVN